MGDILICFAYTFFCSKQPSDSLRELFLVFEDNVEMVINRKILLTILNQMI